MTVTFTLKGEMLLELVSDCRHIKKVLQKGIVYSVTLNLKMTPTVSVAMGYSQELYLASVRSVTEHSYNGRQNNMSVHQSEC